MHEICTWNKNGCRYIGGLRLECILIGTKRNVQVRLECYYINVNSRDLDPFLIFKKSFLFLKTL